MLCCSVISFMTNISANIPPDINSGNKGEMEGKGGLGQRQLPRRPSLRSSVGQISAPYHGG